MCNFLLRIANVSSVVDLMQQKPLNSTLRLCRSPAMGVDYTAVEKRLLSILKCLYVADSSDRIAAKDR
ncbi:hypothetical protein OUZ56_030602 [Daphnia magna]|uniref:Uncharacterized protein n=1 Tax=Daphnia magna TaxID=35525 RepID=A0ABQ9ZSC0_9CRUS|nr:hypothetical protein OUZ56_030602 [Daphnia magna]